MNAVPIHNWPCALTCTGKYTPSKEVSHRGVTLKTLSSRVRRCFVVRVEKKIYTQFTINIDVVTDPGGKYGYSSNYDQLQDGKSTGQNINDFLRFSQGSFGVDIGAEYLIKDDYAPLYDDMERLEYNTKIGISILDVGRNLYKHGRYSRTFNGVLTDVSDDELENKFSSPDDIEDFYDSLETVVQHLQVPATNYYIWQPTRLVINVDKHLRDNISWKLAGPRDFCETQTVQLEVYSGNPANTLYRYTHTKLIAICFPKNLTVVQIDFPPGIIDYIPTYGRRWPIILQEAIKRRYRIYEFERF